MRPFQIVLNGTVKWTETLEESQHRWKRAISDSLMGRRKFCNIKLVNVGFDRNYDALKVVKTFKTSIKSIEICSGHWLAQPLMNVLELLENLEAISIKSSKFCNLEDVEVKHLKKLKRVELTHKEMNVLKIFSKSQITSLETNFLYEMPVAQEKERIRFLENFLSIQSKLESLKIHNVLDNELNNLHKCSGFRLKRLSVDLRNSFESPTVELNFIKFLQVQSNSLQKLEAKCKMSPELLRFIFLELKLLTKFTLDPRYFLLNMSFLSKSMQPSLNVKDLAPVELRMNEKNGF